MKKIFQLLTLKSFSVSAHRKRQFVLSVTLLTALLLFRAFAVVLVLNEPFVIKILNVITYTLIINVTANALRIFIVSNHRKKREISNEDHDSFTVGVNAIVNTTTVISAILLMFVVFDIEIRSFLSSIALFAVALTIIFQDFIKSFLAGFFIMFSADYAVGDYIQVGSMQKGVIRNINFTSVQIRTETGDVLYIPNNLVYSTEITNFSKLKPKRISSEFRLLRSQVTSVDVFEQQLLAYVAQNFSGIFETEKCRIHVQESTKDEIVFVFDASTKKASLKLKEQVNHAIQKFAVEYRG